MQKLQVGLHVIIVTYNDDHAAVIVYFRLCGIHNFLQNCGTLNSTAGSMILVLEKEIWANIHD